MNKFLKILVGIVAAVAFFSVFDLNAGDEYFIAEHNLKLYGAYSAYGTASQWKNLAVLFIGLPLLAGIGSWLLEKIDEHFPNHRHRYWHQ